MYYKVEAGALLPAPKNMVLADGRKVFNFSDDAELMSIYGYTNVLVEGKATLPYEWYEQVDGAIVCHPALPLEPDEVDPIDEAAINDGEEQDVLEAEGAAAAAEAEAEAYAGAMA